MHNYQRRTLIGLPFLFALLLLAGMFSTPSRVLAQQKEKMMMKPEDGSQMVMSKYSFEEATARIRQAIDEQGLMVIHDIDGQAMLKMAGMESGPMHQIFFFHPKYMRRVFEANMMAGIAIPPKVILMEKDGKTVVRYFKPSTLLMPYKGCETIGKELDGIVEKIVSSVK